MEPEKMLRIGGYTGIIAAAMTLLGQLIYAVFLWPILVTLMIGGEVEATGLVTLVIISGACMLLQGPLYMLFGLGFQGGAKKFGKEIGTATFVMALLTGTGIILMSLGLLNLAPNLPTVLNLLATGNLEAALEILASALPLLIIGGALYGIFALIFSILAIIYFFGTEKGTLGGIGGILHLIGPFIGAAAGIGYVLSFVGLLLMGICLLKQARI